MSTASLNRDTFAPQRPPGMRSGLALALAVHALLETGSAAQDLTYDVVGASDVGLILVAAVGLDMVGRKQS